MKSKKTNIGLGFFLFLIIYFILNSSIKADGWQWLKPYPQGNSLEGISFIATVANRGYAVGDLGTVIRTNDNGVNWENIDIGTTENLNDVFMHDDIFFV